MLDRTGDEAVLRGGHEKALHVSPFMGMEQRYAWRAPDPGPTLSVHIESREGARRRSTRRSPLRRRPLSRRSLADVSTRYPASTLRSWFSSTVTPWH